MNQQLVSICIPVYNGAKYLEPCLKSVIEQTYMPIEIIIVDDGSTDRSIEIINSYKSIYPYIQFYINNANLGLVGNWNRCIELANGEWIKFVFQDDYITNNCIERMMEYANIDIFLITCNREFIFESGVTESLKKEYEVARQLPQKVFNINSPEFISAKFICNTIYRRISANFIGEPTVVMFRKSLIKELGFFNTYMVQICDLEYWLRIASTHGLFYTPETLAFFRVHGLSTTSENRNFNLDIADTIVLINEFIYGKYYYPFRKQFNGFNKIELNLRFKWKAYEILTGSDVKGNEKLFNRLKMLESKIPSLQKLIHPSFALRLLIPLIYLKRLVLSFFISNQSPNHQGK